MRKLFEVVCIVFASFGIRVTVLSDINVRRGCIFFA
jgi:hypothetical protein